MPVRVSCLGRFAVEPAPGVVAGPWGRPTARRLVAILVLRPNHLASREELAAWLAPDLSPIRAANAVSKALSMARAVLHRSAPGTVEWLASDRTNVWLIPNFALEVDVEQHQQALRCALATSPGPSRDAALSAALAEDRPLLDDEPYADWAAPARDRLEALRQEGRLELARGRRDRSTAPGLSALAEAWWACLAHDPASEEAAIGLMTVYASQGHRDLAIRTYHRCRAALEELGASPGPALSALHRAVLVAPSPGTEAPRPRPAAPAPTPPGREVELRALLRRLRGAPVGRGGACLIAGPAGIGKSHLVQVVAGRLEHQGWTVTTGTAMPDDRRSAFAALRLALSAIAGPPGATSTRLERLLGRSPARPGSPSLAPGSEGAVLASEIGALLDTVSRASPALLAIDDLQWADPGLQSVLARLAARPGPRRWAVLLAARSDEPRAPVPRLPSTVLRVDLPPLPPGPLAVIIRRAAGTRGQLAPAAAAAISERSQGNPFFAIELVRAACSDRPESAADASSSVPARILELLRGRLRQATVDGRRLVPMVALAGEESSYELLLRLGPAAGIPEARTVRALDQLVRAHLVTEVPAGLRLAHPLLHEAALAEVSTLHRARLHERIADHLDQLGPGLAGMRQEAAARHRLLAFEAGRLRALAAPAAAAAFTAGQRARDLLAPGVAIALLEGGRAAFDALDPDQQARLRAQAVAASVALGDTLLDGNLLSRAEAAYRWGLQLATGDEERGRLWSAIGGLAYRHGDMAAAALAYHHGLSEIDQGSSVARGRLLSDLGWTHWRQAHPEEALAAYGTAMPLLQGSPDPLDRARLFDRLAVALAGTGRPEEAMSASDRALAAAARLGSEREMAALHIHRAGLLSARGQHDEARAQAQEGIRIAQAAGDVYLESVGHWSLAQTLDALGDRSGALVERDRELALLIDIDNPRNLAGNQAHRARLLLGLGRADASRTAARNAREAAHRTADPALVARVEAVLETEVPAD